MTKDQIDFIFIAEFLRRMDVARGANVPDPDVSVLSEQLALDIADAIEACHQRAPLWDTQ